MNEAKEIEGMHVETIVLLEQKMGKLFMKVLINSHTYKIFIYYNLFYDVQLILGEFMD